jgi:toxin FitB
MSVLLDTNVISELVKGAPNERVLVFVSELRSAWIAAITIHELDYGVALLPLGRRRAALEAILANALMEYSDRILPITRAEAQAAAALRDRERRRGRVLHLPHALIAATAMERGLTLATRNVADFDFLGVDVVDPWAG